MLEKFLSFGNVFWLMTYQEEKRNWVHDAADAESFQQPAPEM
jgi:hypothetical protein